jgi:hypothetical protein
MTAKEKTNVKPGGVYQQTTTLPDDFPSELRGEFSEFTDVNIRCIGIVAGHAVTGGGYFGLSVTDDGDSCKLVVRHKKLAFEKRCGSIKQLETLLAYCQRKLTD